MLATSEMIEAVAGALKRCPAFRWCSIRSWSRLAAMFCSTTDAIDTLRTVLLPRATVITPNLPEAAKLLGGAIAPRRARDGRTGAALKRLGAKAVLSKAATPTAPRRSTLLLDADGRAAAGSAARRRPGNTHGTGCTLSSAIAAELAKGASLREAVAAAKAYVTAAIAAADELEIGKGRGPVHHFHALWPRK